jgi:hypothetical protein
MKSFCRWSAAPVSLRCDLPWKREPQLRSFDVKGCNSFIFRIARGVTEIDPRKSASVRNSGISRWRLISGRMGIFQD